LIDGVLETGMRISQEPLGSVRMCADSGIVTRHRLLEHRLDHEVRETAAVYRISRGVSS
jgi:hypothetical protein